MAVTTVVATVVATVVDMKVAVLRHSLTGGRAGWMAFGTLAGLSAAAATIWLTTRSSANPGVTGDLLCLMLALWWLGWMVGPVWTGSGSLRPAEFALLPLARWRLATGLTAATLVGVGAAVTAIAFTALVFHGASLGVGPTLVAVVAFGLQLLLVVVVARLTAGLFGSLSRSRVGAAVVGITTAALMVIAQWGWMVIIAIDSSGVLDAGLSGGFAKVLRWLPSSWGIVGMESADRSEWPLAAAAVAGLAVLIGGLFALYVHALGRTGAARPVIRGPAARPAMTPRRRAGSPTAVVVAKELRTWWRDPIRFQLLFVAPTFALLLCVLPLSFGEHRLLAWTAPLCAQMATVTCANLYGSDGTALWSTLLTPGAARHDVRGRPLAWLTVFAPLSLTLGVATTAFAPQADAWAPMLAVTVVFLSGGAGLVVAVGTIVLVPGADARRLADSPLDHGDTTGQAILTFLATIVIAAPTGIVAYLGERGEDHTLRWAAVPVGLGSGLLAWWLGGRIAIRQVEENGPELLQLIRTGRAPDPARGATNGAGDAAVNLTLAALIGSIALFPQAIVPAAIKMNGGTERVWFLALYLPAPWQWPCILAMAAVGVAGYLVAVRTYRQGRPSGATP